MNTRARERLYGSDPFTRRALENADRVRRFGACKAEWANRQAVEEPDHAAHHCLRVLGHGGLCRCACNATRRRP